MTFFRKTNNLNIWAIASWNNLGKISGASRNQMPLTWIVYDPPVPVNTGALSKPSSGTIQSEASAIAVLSEFIKLAW